MLRHLFWASVILCALAGLAHTGIGLVSFEPLSPNLAWYLNAGMAMLLVALANSAVWHPAPHPARRVRLITHAANFMMGLFAIVAARATGEPRIYIGLIGVIGLFITGMMQDRTPKALTEQEVPTNPS